MLQAQRCDACDSTTPPRPPPRPTTTSRVSPLTSSPLLSSLTVPATASEGAWPIMMASSTAAPAQAHAQAGSEFWVTRVHISTILSEGIHTGGMGGGQIKEQ